MGQTQRCAWLKSSDHVRLLLAEACICSLPLLFFEGMMSVAAVCPCQKRPRNWFRIWHGIAGVAAKGKCSAASSPNQSCFKTQTLSEVQYGPSQRGLNSNHGAYLGEKWAFFRFESRGAELQSAATHRGLVSLAAGQMTSHAAIAFATFPMNSHLHKCHFVRMMQKSVCVWYITSTLDEHLRAPVLLVSLKTWTSHSAPQVTISAFIDMTNASF